MTWLLYMTPPNKQSAVARELRARKIEPNMLMAFPEIRRHKRSKVKRPGRSMKPRYLGPYVALDLTPEQEWLISRPDWLPVAIRPVPQPMGARPLLSPAGVRFWTNPPRGLFRDVDVPRFRDAVGAQKVSVGERVGVYSHGFAGVDAEVISVNGDMTRVRFKDGMFQMEASVPAEQLVRVA